MESGGEMNGEDKDNGINKLKTEIGGFDLIANGGLPQGRSTLVSGTSGSAKTVFAAQFLAAGVVKAKEAGVFVTFEESPEDIRRNMHGFGWDIPTWEKQGRWAFVDASPEPGEPLVVAGGFDLSALLARIEHAVKKVNARRIAIDSLGGVFSQLGDGAIIRHELFRIGRALRSLGVTSVITAERTEEHGPISRFGVQEFVSDNVIVLRNVLEGEVRRRTIEILKFRGADHHKGEWPFTIVAGEGIVVIPLAALQLKQKSSATRISSGNAELDRMCGGGFFRDSIILVSGPTGTGKTLVTTQVLAGGGAAGERCLLFAFEESREQLFRNAMGWRADFAQMEAEGRLKVICTYPEAAALEDHLISMKKVIEQFRPDRLAVDSLSALERVATLKGFREFVIGLTSFIKHQEIPAIFTSTTSALLGGPSITENQISTTTDSILLLRYVELFGEMRRGLTVLKMRGSTHEKEIREYTVDGKGMYVGGPFRNVGGILSGQYTLIEPRGNGEHRTSDMLAVVPPGRSE
jgi:circadian clock protein KaiC